MRLKELRIQGFKSFATKHRFVFPTGITAIVGPNGSGKSNVADAIRWVLGEQRTSQLRARRADEMIFAGTERRARAGLAEVSLTFDNSDGWLDLDFAEVVVSRRVQRDGATSFAINGAPVRLRDLQELLGAHLGQGSTSVIGQGLVDSALALRPEDRRGLIDEAAGLLPLQRKRDQAWRQLAEVDENLTRVRDIVEELGPRLKRMARIAGRAEHHRELAGELSDRLRSWYGYHGWRALEQRTESLAALEAERERIAASRAAVAEGEVQTQAAELALEQAETDLSAARQARDAFAQEAAQSRQRSAIEGARLEDLLARRDEFRATEAGSAAEIAAAGERVEGLRVEHAGLEREAQGLAEAQAAVLAVLAAAEAEHEEGARALERLRGELFRLSAEQAARRQRQAALASNLEAQAEAIAATQTQQEPLAARLAEAGTIAEGCAADLAGTEAGLAAVDAAAAEAEAEATELQASQDAQRTRQAAARSDLEALQARAGALDALFNSLDEALPLAAELRARSEVLGTVAQLIEAEPDWEAAVEAALGRHLRGLVLPDLPAVDAALAEAEGRAEPAEGQVTLAPARSPHAAAAPVAGEARGAEEVARAPRAPDLLRVLLGDTAFVADLPAARALFASTGAGPGPSRAATRDGRLLYRSGAALLGRASGEVLAIERERRSLPEAIAAAGERLAGIEAELDRLAAARRQAEGRLAALTEERTRARAERGAAAAAWERAREERERAERELAWVEESRARLESTVAAIESERAALGEAIDAEAPREAELARALDRAGRQVEAQDLGPARAAAAEAAARLSECRQALAAKGAALAAAEADRVAAEERRLARERAREALEARIGALETALAALSGETEGQGDALTELEGRCAAAEEAVKSARLGLREARARLDALRRALSEAEARLADSRIGADRAQGRLERLGDQVRQDLEWLKLGPPDAGTELPWAEEDIPRLDHLPEDCEAAIDSLRRQLRAIGPIDHESLATYEETADHFATLNAQQADLEAAAQDLRGLLEQLEGEMAERFGRTFGAVAEAFAELFPQLFGGGEAELVLSRDPETDAPTGVDILARPPGKRRQPLALLSGGERSLTAVALIFALIGVSALPFVVLDEVDAALDEANVGRFGTQLQALAGRTQVVIITHNRGTIQTAGTIYGVTMAEDGASQVISLQIEEAVSPPAALAEPPA